MGLFVARSPPRARFLRGPPAAGQRNPARGSLRNSGERVYFFFYYPLGVERDAEGRPWASWALILAMSAVFLACRARPLLLLEYWDWLVYLPRDPLRPGLLLSALCHAGWLHLIGNLFYLWAFGPSLERALGSGRFLLAFGFLAATSNLCQGFASSFGPDSARNLGVVGASGALSGLLGLFLLRFPHARIRTAWALFSPLYGQVRTGVVAVPTALGIGAWLALQLAQLLATSLGSQDNTAYGAHLGGLLIGLLVGVGLGLPRQGRAFSCRHRAERRLTAGDWIGAYEAIHPLLAEKGLAAEPEDFCLAARACRLQGLTREGRRLYRRAVVRSLALGDEAAAAAIYAEALGAFPDLAFPEQQLYRLALALDRLGRRRAAREAFALFRRLYGDSPRLAVALLREARLAEGEDPLRARALYEEQLARFPDSPYGNLARRAQQGLSRGEAARPLLG